MNPIFRYTFGLIILLQVSVSAAPVIVESTNTTSGLRHPGCLQSAAEINALATALAQNDSTRTGYWNSMINNSRGKVYNTDWVPPTDLFGSDFAGPAKYAGAGLIRYINDWIINGNTTSEANAITMLNTWAGVQSFTADPDDGYEHHRLQSMWLGYLAHAADLLISSNTSWPVAEQNAFKDMVENVLLPIANDNRAAGFNANWDMGATWAVMAMAVLLDDKTLFDEQVAWLKDGDTNARISYYLLNSGQNQESARDQGHANMGLTFLSLATQTAWTQGIDLYEYDNRSVAKAFEYNAAYNMGEDDLPFQVYPCAVGSNSAHDTNNVISSIGRPTYFSVYEMVYHHYKNYRGIELPYSKQMLENHTRQEQPGPNWSNHNTALYWNLDLSADAALRQAQSADATLGINTNYAGRASLRLNCGGAHYGATDGRAFTKEKSQWDDGGSSISHSNPIANTLEEKLYQTYRQGGTSGSIYYHFGLPDGAYRVKLHFAEPSYTQANQRKFNVYLEDSKTLDNFDIYATAGSNTATLHETTVTLSDGMLDVRLESITSSAIISAIEIEPLVLQYTLTYTAAPNGTLSGTTPQLVIPDADGRAITAVPEFGYRFVDWSDGRTDNPRIDLNVTSNISVSATFESVAPSTLIYLAGPGGTISGADSQTVAYGAVGSPVTAIANTNHYFVNWSDSITDNPRTDLSEGDISVTANFATNLFSSSIGINFGSDRQSMSASDTAGVVPAPNWNNLPGGSGTVLDLLSGDGLATTLDATYSAATTWVVGGTATSDERMMRGYLDGSRTGALPTATVSQVPFARYDVYIYHQVDEDGDGGSVILNGTESKYIKDAEGTFSGSTGEYIEDDQGADFNSTTAGHYVKFTGVTGTFFSITSTRTLDRVGFTGMQIVSTPSTYTLTYTAGPGGSVSGATSQTVNYNTDGTAVTAVASSDYHFTNWSDGSTDNPRTDLGVTSTLSVTANFEADVTGITVTTTNSLLLADSARIDGGGDADIAFSNTGDLGLKDATGNYMSLALFKADLSTLSGTVEDASLSFLSKNDSACTIYIWGVVDSGATGWDWAGGTSGDVTWNSVISNGLFTPKDHLYSTYGSELILLGTFAADGTASPYNLTHTVSGLNLVNLLNADTDDILTFVVALDANVNLSIRNPIAYTPAAELLVVTSSVAVDSDGDGLTDVQEVALGTDPDNPDSLLEITDSTPLPTSGKIQITWPSASGVLYKVWKSPDLASWTVARDWTAGLTPPMDTLEVDLTPSNGFFKVEADIQ